VAAVGVAALAAAAPAAAQTLEAPSAGIGIAVHPQFGFALPSRGGPGNPGYASYGAGLGYDLTRRLALDVGFERGLGGSRLINAPGGGVQDFETNIGYLARALVHRRVGERALHVVLGAGPALVFSGNYGTVPLLQIEGGLELRARSGFYLLAVLQGVEPLVSSRDEIAAGRCVTGDCPSRFQPGLPLLGSRLAAGYVF
jgi:hypothetical protein